MSEFKADLHCHTNCSDGSSSPVEIIHQAKEAQLSGLSITDHDSIYAYQEAIPEARKVGISLISGVEFSAMHSGQSVHILGYSFSLDSPDIRKFCEAHARRRFQRNKGILDKLAEHGMPVEENELGFSSTLGRPHIALAMLKRGYVVSIKDAFNKYLGDNCPCYVSGGYFTVEETIDIVHKGGGFALIAHPHLIKNEVLVSQLLEMPFDGLEAYYGRFSSQQQERWIAIATKKSWMISGGSDFHGSIKPDQPLGCSWVNHEVFSLFEERYNENNKNLV